MSSRRILVVSEIFYPEGGGAELATYLILKILCKAGFDVTIITGTRRPAIINGAKVYRTDLLGSWNRIKRFMNIFLLAKQCWFIKLFKSHNILYIPLLAYPLIPLAKKYGLEVIVHLHNYVPVRYYGVKYYFENDKINILEELKMSIFHELYANNSMLRVVALPISYILYQISKTWLEHADTIICVSKRQAQIVRDQILGIARKIRVIYNPPPELPSINKELGNTRSIIYAGGRKYIKGYHVLLQAVGILNSALRNNNRRTNPVELILIGDGYESSRLPSTLSTRNFRIRILGRITRDQHIKLHKRTVALVFPSITEEPLPYVIIESMFLKTTPIASRIGGIPEILDDSPASNFLSEPGNSEALANRLADLINMDSSELYEIGRKLREHALQKFSGVHEDLIKVFS